MIWKNRGDDSEKVFVNIYNSSFIYSMVAISVVAVLEIFMLVYSVLNTPLFGPFLWNYRSFYIALLTVALLYVALYLFAKKDIEKRYRWLNVINPLYVVFFFGWALGITYFDYVKWGSVDTTVFVTFSLIVPVGFFVLPQIYGLIVIVADVVMMVMIAQASGGIPQVINTSIFIIFQLVLGVSFLMLKTQLAQRIVQEQKNANVDAMTGCGNRRAYIRALENGVGPQGLTYLAIDINGLKEVNDTRGHDVGDKLIIGAAACTERCFGEKGRVFRTGGDEFVVLMTKGDPEELLAAYQAQLKSWSAENRMELSASCGYARSADHPGAAITELARIADREMLLAKAAYYQQNGRERRQHTAE